MNDYIVTKIKDKGAGIDSTTFNRFSSLLRLYQLITQYVGQGLVFIWPDKF
jgi:hypothetical protein